MTNPIKKLSDYFYFFLFLFLATYKAIEELKASVSRLKLPKEHSPRL